LKKKGLQALSRIPNSTASTKRSNCRDNSMCLPSKTPLITQDPFLGVAHIASFNKVMNMTRGFDSSKANTINGYVGQEEDKHCVQHNYHDHAKDDCATYLSAPVVSKGGVTVPFPTKLHNMLDHIDEHESELSSIVSWQPHGRCFLVKDIKKFTKDVLPRFFEQKKYPSFQRQLNLYGFNRLTKGPDKGSYYHELFLRSKKVLCRGIQRMKVKGTGSRLASNPKQEPNFYQMDSMPSSVTSSLDIESKVTEKRVNAVISPLTPMKQKQQEEIFAAMPPLELPHSVLPWNIKNEDSHTSHLQVLRKTPFTGSSIESREVIDAEGHTQSFMANKQVDVLDEPSDDLRYVFGGMPFHSLDILDGAQLYGRQDSFLIEDSNDNFAPAMIKECKDFEKQMDDIVDLGEEVDLSSDLEMGKVLNRICDETNPFIAL
jgi:hypothetical protein